MARYRAFISYSSRDRRVVEWLFRQLESWRVPKRLVGRETAVGKVPARLGPLFRDRDELSASADLGRDLMAALENSAFLIVACSPAAAASRWVNEEILAFKRMGREDRILAVVVDGLPEAGFPPALRFRLGADGALSDVPAEPIAADLRPEGDGRRLGVMKLVAGLTGLPFDELVQREAQRRARRLTVIASTAVVGMLLTSGLAVYAERQRREAVVQRAVAERERAAAEAATDYLIGVFELVNPATENPRNVSLVTLLERGAERARAELAGQPRIEARLVGTMGRAYANLGLLEEAERTLARSIPAINRAGGEGAMALLVLADIEMRRGALEKAMATFQRAQRLMGEEAPPLLMAQRAAGEGRLFVLRGETEQALAAYDAGLEALAAMDDAPARDRARLLGGRGEALRELGRHDEADVALIEANRLYRQALGEQHLATANSWQSLALNAFLAGRHAEALARLARAEAVYGRVLDAANPTRADALSLKGQVLHAQGRLPEAARALDDAITLYAQSLGPRHYVIGIAEIYRALVAADQGRTSEALEHLELARGHYDASYGGEHPNHGDLLVNRAQILARAGRVSEALRDCAAGLAILDRTMGPAHGFTRELRARCDGLPQA